MKQKLRLGDCYALTKHKLKQFKIRYISLLAVLTTMCLYAVKQVSAQEAEPAATAVADIKPLQVGDTVPEWLWHLPLQVVNNPEGKDTITLSEYRGKLIILDFWATWCGSCISAMPQINDTRQQFGDEVMVLPVSRSNRGATEDVLQNHKTLQSLGLFSIVEAEMLINLFPHGVVPHYVWIAPQGRVVATMATEDVTEQNIANVLKGGKPDFALKTYIDETKPLLFDGESMPNTVQLTHYALFIRGEIPSISGGTHERKTDGILNGYAIYNRTLLNIYQIIASKIKRAKIPVFGDVGRKRMVLTDTIDNSQRCSFEFIFPPNRADVLFTSMLSSLNQCSGYLGRWTKREMPCLILTKIDGRGGFVSNPQDESYRVNDDTVYTLKRYPINYLVGRLNWRDISASRIVLNETGYGGMVNIALHAPFDDFTNIRGQLKAYGLDLFEAEREIEIFEIRKAPFQQPQLTEQLQ